MQNIRRFLFAQSFIYFEIWKNCARIVLRRRIRLRRTKPMTQNKTCQNCKSQFVIEPEDFDFYKKISVPPPTWCPECRQRHRYAWRNERVLYRRNCDLCGKSTVTIYSPNKPYKVYCTYHTGKCPNEFETTYRP